MALDGIEVKQGKRGGIYSLEDNYYTFERGGLWGGTYGVGNSYCRFERGGLWGVT